MKSLLIVESSGIIVGAVERALRTRYDVHVCRTGSDALRLLEELQPDVVIIDLSLIDMDGLSVLRKTQYVPPLTLALTCYIDSHVCNAATLCGVSHILMLPCSMRSIIKHLDELLYT